ncbi:hypothetical protein K1T71_000570 [Dendrolimus kikuchii]|uniref:Uncharacterized protein n=1 Tax=Dendrolimus kikuchii TaxID=765133 RepID=A0ACC1DKT2_9NEOP|nr:hypothetical protein K1T71_000570 [Dendrolimus kikuchii]
MADTCRVCLCSDRRMYTISNTAFQEVWEKLTNAKFNTNDGKPLLVCYICGALLRKSHQLMKRAQKAEELLTTVINNESKQSQKAILLVASQTHHFDYKYSIGEMCQLECKQFEGYTVGEIKKENKCKYKTDNGEENDIHIKQETVGNTEAELEEENVGVNEEGNEEEKINIKEEAGSNTEDEFEEENVEVNEEGNEEENDINIKEEAGSNTEGECEEEENAGVNEEENDINIKEEEEGASAKKCKSNEVPQKFNTNDGKPLLVCYICGALLRKSHQLMKRAQKAEELVTTVINNGSKQSQKAILMAAGMMHDVDYNYAIGEMYQLECKQFERNTVEEIEEDNEEGNEQEIDINIKEEEGGDTEKEIKKENVGMNEEGIDVNIKEEEEGGSTEKEIKKENVEMNEEGIDVNIKEEEGGSTEKEIKKEDVGMNEEGIHINIKEEEGDYPYSSQEENLDIIDVESGLSSGENMPQKKTLKRKTVIILKKIDMGMPAKKSKLNEVLNIKIMMISDPDPQEGCSNLSNYSSNMNVKDEMKGDEDEDTFNTMAFLELARCVQANQEPLDYNPTDALVNPKTNLMVCLYCLDEFDPQMLSEHLMNVHNYRRVMFKCHYCGSVFQEKKLLYVHRADCKPPPKRSKRKTFAQIMREVEDKYLGEDQNQYETVTCPICVLEMPKYCLKEHLLTVHKKVDVSCDCPHCGKTFKSKLTLREHVKLVHEAIEDSVACEKCGQKFRSMKYLSNHKRNVHPKDDQVHKCHVCGKEFKSRLCLHQHTKYVHPPAEASAACPHCENKVRNIIKTDGLLSRLAIYSVDRLTIFCATQRSIEQPNGLLSRPALY